VTVASGSTINSNDVLRVETMPDGGATVKEVNRQGELILMTDANSTVHQYTRSKLGELTADTVVNLADNVDDAILRIALSYDVRRLLEKITSYDAASGGSVVNEVQNAYNDFQQLQTQYQEHGGPVNTSTSLKVQYVYADGSANTIRPTGVTYPNLRNLAYDYAAGTPDDKLSRIGSLTFDNVTTGSTTVAGYSYLGLGTPVIAQYANPAILQYNLATGSVPNLYAGLDRFGRVIDCRWQTTGGSPTDVARLGYGYDRASNRQWREDKVSKSLSTPQYFDEYYSYDGLYRLTGLARGQLNGTYTGITGENFGQTWDLDATGNWKEFTEAASGTTTTLDQSRTANAANEITAITNTVGSAWGQPGYDPAGNMTAMPQPDAPGDGYSATFDAWHRMRKLFDVTNGTPVQVQENKYDGRNYRIVKAKYSSGTLSETRDFYYSDTWQALEERVSGSPNRQYVWGLRYIDDLVLRDRSTSGTLDERRYALQDANWNVLAFCDTSGAVSQRVAYTAYGVAQFLNALFVPISGNSYDWTVLYTGRVFDGESGLYYYRMRYYHPVLGAFVSRDPIGYAGGSKLYSYVDCNPLIRTDPEGKDYAECRIFDAFCRNPGTAASIIKCVWACRCPADPRLQLDYSKSKFNRGVEEVTVIRTACEGIPKKDKETCRDEAIDPKPFGDCTKRKGGTKPTKDRPPGDDLRTSREPCRCGDGNV
jgi:RHS repeat-associated protein